MSNNEIIIYTTEDGKVKIETHFKNETVWLSIDQIAELFQKSRSTINEQIGATQAKYKIVLIKPAMRNDGSSFTDYDIHKYLQKSMSCQRTGEMKIVANLKVRCFKISLPPTRTEQTAIATALSEMDSEIEKLETQLSKYKMLKTDMTQELLTGKRDRYEKKIKNTELQQFSNFVIFQTENGKVNIDVYFQDETLWLTQKMIAELFEKGRSTITEHLRKIFADGELDENSVCRDFRHTAEDGKQYTTKYYNLKAIIAVGYRVNSHRAINRKVMNRKIGKAFLYTTPSCLDNLGWYTCT